MKYFTYSFLVIIVLSSCTNMGTAVVMWPPEDSIWQPGDLAVVKDDSFLRNTYIVNLPGQRRLKEEIDQWRLKLFKRRKDAAAWAISLAEWRDAYAESLYQGLPMRKEAANTSEQIFRFREGDSMKVLGREPGPIQVGNLEGYWYKVLAFGGVEGYVFDYHLKVMKISGGTIEVLNAKDTDDDTLDNFLAQPWRPGYYSDMLITKQINLDLFRSEYGLFIDTNKKILTMNLPGKSFAETWTEIIPLGKNRYDFLGTSFRITVNSPQSASIQYTFSGIEYYEAFVRLNQRVSNIIANTLNRQTNKINSLINQGPVYKSRAYGTLTFLKQGRFTWSEKSSLISRNLLTAEAGGSGSVKFGLFMDPSITKYHEGVISLQFDSGETLHCLYAFEEGGLRFLYVPTNAIKDNTVTTDQFFNSIRIFFEASAENTGNANSP